MVRVAESSPLDRVFHAVANSIRREMLCLLHIREDEVAPIAGIADHLATTHDSTNEEVTLALRHVHLPKLREDGLVDYDERSGEVRYSESEFFSALLECDLIECEACNRTAKGIHTS